MTTKERLRIRWQQLQTLDSAPLKVRQKRGYELERLIFDLLEFEGLNPALPYRGIGEQIDGMFEIGERYFSMEMKWEQNPVSASPIYAFRAKVEGKLMGTIGVFISINGYSADAPEALRYGKTINTILVDGEDIEFALADEYSFTEVLKAKLRYAAQYGVVYYRYELYLDTKEVR